MRHKIFLIFFLLFSFQALADEMPTGEENLIDNAERLANNEELYTDIKTFLAPGQFYFASFIKGTFLYDNYQLIVTLLFVFILAFIFRSSYLNNDKLPDKHYPIINLLVIFTIALLIKGYISISSSLLFSFLIVFINTVIIFKYYETKKLIYLIIGGALLGVAGIFRHDVTAYLYGAEFWGIFFFGIKFYADKNANWFKKFLTGMKYGIIFTAGILITFLPAYLYFLFNSGADNLYYQLIEFPVFEFKALYNIPLPNPFNAFSFKDVYHSIWFYIPIVIFIITAFKLYFQSKAKTLTSDDLKFWKIIFLFNLGINSYNQALIVSDTYHLLPALIVSALLFYFVVDRLRFRILSVYLYMFLLIILGLA